MNMLGLLEAFDRNGALLGRLPVHQWPVTVGRGLLADLVLDDPHIASGHLRIDREPDAGGAPGPVTVDVLNTQNGVSLGNRTHKRGEHFEWPAGEDLYVGRLRIALRLADAPIAAEQPLPRFPWVSVGVTVALLAVLLVVQLGRTWLEANETKRFLQQLPFSTLYVLGTVALWSGLWALATKLFSGRLNFWRHVRIACATFIVSQAFMLVTNLLAFMFSWESLAKFAWIGLALVTAVGVAVHLTVIAPRRMVWIAGSMAGVLLIGIPGLLGTQWLQNKRLSNELYMAVFFPPDWRAAPTVPVQQLLDDTRNMKARVDARISEGDEDEDASSSDDDE